VLVGWVFDVLGWRPSLERKSYKCARPTPSARVAVSNKPVPPPATGSRSLGDATRVMSNHSSALPAPMGQYEAPWRQFQNRPDYRHGAAFGSSASAIPIRLPDTPRGQHRLHIVLAGRNLVLGCVVTNKVTDRMSRSNTAMLGFPTAISEYHAQTHPTNRA
jgi:hypothetical protein